MTDRVGLRCCEGCDKGLPVDRNDHLGWYHYVAKDCGCEIHSGQRYEGRCAIRNAERRTLANKEKP